MGSLHLGVARPSRPPRGGEAAAAGPKEDDVEIEDVYDTIKDVDWTSPDDVRADTDHRNGNLQEVRQGKKLQEHLPEQDALVEDLGPRPLGQLGIH